MKRLNEIEGVVARKRHISGYGTTGDPDVYGSARGIHFEMEVKRPGKAPTPLQIHRLGEWEEAGAVVGIVHSVEEALILMGTALRRTNQDATDTSHHSAAPGFPLLRPGGDRGSRSKS